MVTVSRAVTVNVPAVALLMVTVQVATLPLTLGPLTVGVRPPVTVTARAPKLGVPVPPGKAVTVTVNTSWFFTSLTGVNGVMAIPTIASYNVSKGGVNQLTRVMALALADRKVRVNAVAPGTIATELAKNAVLGSDEARARIMSRTPMKRLGDPSEIADVTAFLLSSAASYMTGEIVYVDGGRLTLNYTVAA